MTNTATALYTFWSGFQIPAYVTGNVPEETELPYITYSLTETEWGQSSTHYAQVWYRGTNLTALMSKVDEIKAAIGEGTIIKCTGGYVALRLASPPVQFNRDQDRTIMYAYINLQLNCYHG